MSTSNDNLYRFVKATPETLSEFENRDKGYVVRYSAFNHPWEFWKWDWINERLESSYEFEILLPVEADQQELWERFLSLAGSLAYFQDAEDNVRYNDTLSEIKSQFHLIKKYEKEKTNSMGLGNNRS